MPEEIENKSNNSVEDIVDTEDGLVETAEPVKAKLKETISIDDFLKLDIRVGEVLSVDDIENADKLYKLKVDFGPYGVKQILSGIKGVIAREYLLGKQFPFVVNLAERKMKGEISQGMILATGEEALTSLLVPDRRADNGDKVR